MAPSIKVLCASRRFWPEYSGAEIRLQRYAPGLEDRGIGLEFVTVRSSELPTEDFVGGVPVHRVANQSSRLMGNGSFFNSFAGECLRRKPDVAQVISLTPAAIPHLIRIKRAGIPIVSALTVMASISGSTVRRSLQKFRRRLAFEFVDCIIAATQVMKEYLHEIGVNGRIEVIHNGVDVDRFRPLDECNKSKEALRKELGIEPDAEVVIFIGGMATLQSAERKGVPLILKSWDKVLAIRPNAILLLVGPNDALRNYGIDESRRIITTGRVSNVESYLQCADVFLLTSTREGMANAVLEAMACGVPSILTHHIGLPAEFGRPDSQFLLVPREAEALAGAICSLLDNKRQMQALSQNSRRWVLDHLSLNGALDMYASLYKDVARR